MGDTGLFVPRSPTVSCLVSLGDRGRKVLVLDRYLVHACLNIGGAGKPVCKPGQFGSLSGSYLSLWPFMSLLAGWFCCLEEMWASEKSVQLTPLVPCDCGLEVKVMLAAEDHLSCLLFAWES